MKTKTTLTTRTVPVAKLAPLPNNPRRTLTPDDPGWRRLTKSIDTHGYIDPLVWNEQTGHVLSGNQRLAILREQGAEEVDVVVVDLPAEREMAVALTLNKHAGEWDGDLLTDALDRMLALPDFDVEVTGFDVAEVEDLLASIALPDDLLDDAEAEAALIAQTLEMETPITQTGDLIQLGPHRLLCGDSALEEDLDRLLDGAKIHMVNTDPPYGVNVEPRSKRAIAAGNSSFGAPNGSKKPSGKMRAKDRRLKNDDVTGEEYDQLLSAWFGNIARVLLPGRAFYVWGGYGTCASYVRAFEPAGLHFSQAIAWVKEHPVINRKDLMGNYELCFYGWREGAAHKFFGPKNVTDVWSVKKKSPQSMLHLTEKPVELAVRAMHYSSRKGENVLDLFGGSGSTLIAAAQSGRTAFLMELDPAYCDVIVRRFIASAGATQIDPDVVERYRLQEHAA